MSLPLSLSQWCVTPSDNFHIGGNNNDVNDADDDTDDDANDDVDGLVDADDLFLGKPINRSNVHSTGLYEELQTIVADISIFTS